MLSQSRLNRRIWVRGATWQRRQRTLAEDVRRPGAVIRLLGTTLILAKARVRAARLVLRGCRVRALRQPDDGVDASLAGAGVPGQAQEHYWWHDYGPPEGGG